MPLPTDAPVRASDDESEPGGASVFVRAKDDATTTERNGGSFWLAGFCQMSLSVKFSSGFFVSSAVIIPP